MCTIPAEVSGISVTYSMQIKQLGARQKRKCLLKEVSTTEVSKGAKDNQMYFSAIQSTITPKIPVMWLYLYFQKRGIKLMISLKGNYVL